MTIVRSRWPRLLAATAAASLSFASLSGIGAARAQGAPGGSAMDDEARRLYDEARKAKDKGDHGTCVAKTRAAWALKKHRQVAGLLGECELKTGAHREAAEHLAYFLDHAEDAAPELVAAVRANYDAARAEIAVVTVKASAPDADRKVDGRTLAADEARVFLAPGEHVFSAAKGGGGSAEKRVFVAAGQERDVVLELEAPKDGATPPPTTPAPAPTAPPESKEGGGPSIVPGLVLGGVGLVGVGVGVALLVASGGPGDDATAIANEIVADDGKCDPATAGFESRCADYDDAASDEATLQTVGVIALIGGGAMLIGGGAWTVWAATSEGGSDAARAPHVTVTPTFGLGGAGLRAGGTF